MPASDIYVSWDESVNCVQEMWRGAEFCFVSPVGARASAVLQSAQMAADQYCSAAVRDWAGASADGHVEVTPPSE